MIVTRKAVHEAVERALDGACYGDIQAAREAAAAELCLPIEAVREAMQPVGHCCAAGENLGVSVCDECAEECAQWQGCLGTSRRGFLEDAAEAADAIESLFHALGWSAPRFCGSAANGSESSEVHHG